MSRISMISISLMAALAFSANAASAGSVVVRTPTPNVKVQTPQPKIGSQSTGAGAGKVTFNPFSITRKVDRSSPNLYQQTSTGKHISKDAGNATAYDAKPKPNPNPPPKDPLLKINNTAGESLDKEYRD
jgi:Type VI secretion system effector, Hcp